MKGGRRANSAFNTFAPMADATVDRPTISRRAAAPSDSWWTRPRTREEFSDAAKRETPRMTASRAASTVRPMTVGEINQGEQA